MKYKVGDKVRIKTWEQMEEEFGLTNLGSINLSQCHFPSDGEEKLHKYSPDRILMIEQIGSNSYYGLKDCYCLKDMGPKWPDEMIEGLVADEYLKRPVVTRFDLMDFED